MKGILFTPENARLICQKLKWQTRRIESAPGRCYRAGERLALLTTWAVGSAHDQTKPRLLELERVLGCFWHAGQGEKMPEWAGRKRPGRFLPNTLRGLVPVVKIVDVRTEPLQSISGAECIAEGCHASPITRYHFFGGPNPVTGGRKVFPTPLQAYADLWDSINGQTPACWANNPTVTVYTFDLVGEFGLDVESQTENEVDRLKSMPVGLFCNQEALAIHAEKLAEAEKFAAGFWAAEAALKPLSNGMLRHNGD